MFALFMLYFVFLHTVHPYASPHVQFMFHSSFVSGISLFCPFCILSVSWVTLFGLYYPAHIMYTVAGAGYEISFLARSRFNFREGRVFFRSEKKLEAREGTSDVTEMSRVALPSIARSFQSEWDTKFPLNSWYQMNIMSSVRRPALCPNSST